MKSILLKFIANGNLEEAFKLLDLSDSDAVMLQARFNNGNRQYKNGLIGQSEWNTLFNNITNSFLEYVRKMPDDLPGTIVPNIPITPSHTYPGVFISYSRQDKQQVEKIKKALTDQGVAVTIDEDGLGAGDSIVDFIRESMKNNRVVLSVVSANSLRSGWVGKESIAAYYSDWLGNNRFIPVSLDATYLDSEAYVGLLESISEELKQKEDLIAKARSFAGDSRPLEDERNRLSDHRSNLGKILQRIRDVNVVDLSDAQFSVGIDKILQKLKTI